MKTMFVFFLMSSGNVAITAVAGGGSALLLFFAGLWWKSRRNSEGPIQGLNIPRPSPAPDGGKMTAGRFGELEREIGKTRRR